MAPSKLAVMQLGSVAVLAAVCLVVLPSVTIFFLLFWWVALPLVAVFEAVAWPLIYARKYARLNAQPATHRPPSHTNYDPRSVFDRFITNASNMGKYICLKTMMQKWHWGVPLDQVKRGNVADLMAYGFWYRSREELEAEGQGHLPDQLVMELEQAWGISFPEGHTPGLPFMSHLWQDINCHYRPMCFYLGIEVLYAAKHLLMLGSGFRTHSHRGYTYYTHGIEKPSADKEDPSSSKAPILFLHGVGLGLLPYVTFVQRLAASGHPVLAVESCHLGMRWVHEVPNEDEVVDVLVEIMDQLGIGSAAVVGHSYGTFMASRLVQRLPQRVQSLALLDPVCFLMHDGKLIHNFVYAPQNGALTTWLVARDLHHATSVCRNFFWSQLNLWPDQLPPQTLVVLSGKDDLVPVEATIKMLTGERPDVGILLHESHKHADFIKDLPWQDLVVRRVLELVEKASMAGPVAASGFKSTTDTAAPALSANDCISIAPSEICVAAAVVIPQTCSRAIRLRCGAAPPVYHGRNDSALIPEHHQLLQTPSKMCTRSATRATGEALSPGFNK